MSNAYLGEVRAFGFNYAPRGWMTCSGQILGVTQYSALFSLLGSQYGGNGSSTFALPDLRSRVGVNAGTGTGLSTYPVGTKTGQESETLLSTEMPSHTHTPYSRIKPGTADGHLVPVAGDYVTRLNVTANAPGLGWHSAPPNGSVTMHPTAIGLQGGSQPHSNIQPILALNYCICVSGIYPQRN